jgi:prepilin peptidase CpaA
MPELLTNAVTRLGSQGNLLLPFLLTLWMAWGDVQTRRIPNYLTLGTALAGLAYQLSFHGPAGLVDGLLGMILGFGLLILPYLRGGMGAGDVKALASLGAWLGLWPTLFLFCYMGVAGGILALGVLCWKGLLWAKLHEGRVLGINWILCRSYGPAAAPTIAVETKGIPYAVALALGMAALLWEGV